jgi:hypothetical protein
MPLKATLAMPAGSILGLLLSVFVCNTAGLQNYAGNVNIYSRLNTPTAVVSAFVHSSPINAVSRMGNRLNVNGGCCIKRPNPTQQHAATAHHTSDARRRCRAQKHLHGIRMSGGIMNLLEQDVVSFLATSVAVVPVCKQLNISPVLGFLGAGLALGPYGLGLLKDLSDLNVLGEIGILFLLFEQGLELSVERLKSLAKYAFGLGTLQVGQSPARTSPAWPMHAPMQCRRLSINSPSHLACYPDSASWLGTS